MNIVISFNRTKYNKCSAWKFCWGFKIRKLWNFTLFFLWYFFLVL